MDNLFIPKNRRRYNLITQILAIKTHLISPSCYSYLQNLDCLTLPHVNTLDQRCPTGGPRPYFVRPTLRPKCLYPYQSRVHAPVLRPATEWYEAVATRSKYSWTALP